MIMCLPRLVWHLLILAVLVVFYEEAERKVVAVVKPSRNLLPASRNRIMKFVITTTCNNTTTCHKCCRKTIFDQKSMI